LDQEQG